MPARKIIAQSPVLVLLVALLAGEAQGGTTQLTDTPISGASSVQVSPNIQFVLDDSASMNDSYLPDWAGVQNLPLAKTKNPSFNGIAYNPAVSYSPPKYFSADGSADTTTYLSQSSANTAVWKAVKNDGYGVQSTTTSNLIGNAYYFTTVAGEYCTNNSLKTCIAASAASEDYPVAAKLRWCKTAADAVAAVPADGACQATQIEPNPSPPATALNTPFTFPRMPSPRVSTFTISGSDSTSVTSLKVNGQEILSAATNSTPLPETLANAITEKINACTFGLTGSCQVVGYSAEAAGNTVIISAPEATGAQPAITKTGSMTISPPPFARPSSNSAPGENLLTVITDPVATVYPKTANRSDCAADPCSYAEEMTNYANWWAYYSTRMQAMKTAASLSFEPIGSNKRIGYSTINNNTGSDFQNIAAFDGAQKRSWYDKLFAAIPQSNTPLRAALANIGRLYAGQLNGSAFNGTTVVDPVQYYCQQNVAILSTDGYWNEAAGYQLDGTTAVGDQDGPGLETRPQLDGGGPQALQETLQNRKILTPGATWRQKKTERVYYKTASLLTQTYDQLQSRTSGVEFRDAIVESSTSQLEFRTKLIKTATLKIQSRISTLQKNSGELKQQTLGLESKTLTKKMEQTSPLQTSVGQRQRMTYQLQQRLTQVQKRTSSNGGTSWTDWGAVTSCTPVASGIERTQCWTQAVGEWNAVSSCAVASGETIVTDPGSDGERTTYNTKSECRYDSPAWLDVATCTGPATAVLPADYSVEHPFACRTSSWGSWTDVGACTRNLDAGVDCRYGEWTTAVPNPSCTPLAQAPDFSVAIARQCSLDWTDAWVDSGASCTANATTQCRYQADWSGLTGVSSCTPVAASGGTTLVPQVACPIVYSGWEGATTCTKDTTGRWRTDCQYTEWTGYGADPSCPGSELPQSAGPTYTVQTAKQCRVEWSDYTTTDSCTPVDNVTRCRVEWSDWSNAMSTCTPVAETATTGTECRYKDWSAWSADASCVTTERSPGPDSYPQVLAKHCQQTTFPATWTATAAECIPSSTRQCRYADWSAWSANPACTEIARAGTPTLPAGGARQCQIGWTAPSTAGASCTTSAERQCAYAAWSGWSLWPSADECTDAAQSSGPTYAPARQCLTVLMGDWSPKTPTSYATNPPVFTSGTSCTEGTVGGVKTSCRWVVPPPTQPIPVAECNEETMGDGTVVSCSPLSTGPTEVARCTPSDPVEGNSYVMTTCLSPTTSGQTPDTLADVAEYYWKTDLRDPAQSSAQCSGGPIVTDAGTSTTDVCTNDAKYDRQFMNTYTLGLGASGLMQYQSNYLSAASGDFASVSQGVTANPATGVCSWQNDGACNWPKPESNKQSNIDDLWHAAVNGRGTYFSADNPATLAAGISNALIGIDIKSGSLTAVTVTSPNLGSADDAVFEISFKSDEWSGEMVKRAIDSAGVIAPETQWSAQAKLDSLVSSGTHTARHIYTYNRDGESASAAADNLKFFLWENLSVAEKNAFKKPAISALSQFCASGTTCLAEPTQDLASGENLLKFVRGEKLFEGPLADTGLYYRERNHVLGDIVGSEAVYVKGSPWSYADYGYSAFKTANTSRKAMVYVGANDGMLHAFAAADGVESWAYVPAMLIPKLYTLADKNYRSRHQFFVDGTPAMGDICASNCSAAGAVWKTILVGGFNHGGRGYYALDITDPDSPKALWEFSNDNLGYSYGNPVISKLKDGTWVVMFSSGYNNVNPGDGDGRLFIINADSGELIRSITTDSGSTGTPSGLSRISAWANYPDSNNTAQRVYGGDLLGNLWRFDINGDIPEATTPPDYDAQRLATFKDGAGNAQPITSKPELGKIKNHPVIFVATGQLLGVADLTTTQTQSIYAIKDQLTATDYGNPRSSSTNFVSQTLASGTCSTEMAATGYCAVGEAIVQGGTANAVNFTTDGGWYADFPVAGERVNTDLRLIDRTLTFNTNTPKLGACVPVGVSFAYYLDYRSGTAVEGTNSMAGRKIADALATTPSLIRLADGTIKEYVRTDGPDTPPLDPPIGPDDQSVRRVSWRELVTE